jgi:hypothetical protein
MKGRGFAYRPQPANNDRRPDDPSPYALISPTAARTNGYGIVAAILNHPSPQPADPNAAALGKLTAQKRQDWTKALTGTPSHIRFVKVTSGMVLHYNTDGCVHIANDQLYGSDWDAIGAQVQDDSNMVLQQSLATAAVTSAIKGWASCLGRAGYVVSHLDDLRGRIQSQLGAATSQSQLLDLGREELADATADAHCQAVAHVASVIATMQARVEAGLPSPVRQRLSTYLKDKAHALNQAAVAPVLSSTVPSPRHS